MTRSAQSPPSANLVGLDKVGTSALYAAGATIFRQAEEADSVCYIEDGLVKIDVALQQGKRAVVALLARDTFLAKAVLPARHRAPPAPSP